MTKQEIFDVAVRGVIAQGKQARKVSDPQVISSCAFRAPDGCKCAVGHVIPDDEYDESFDYVGHNTDVLFKFASKWGVEVAFLKGLQRCHDNAPVEGFVNMFKLNARLFAKDNDLNTLALEPAS